MKLQRGQQRYKRAINQKNWSLFSIWIVKKMNLYNEHNYHSHIFIEIIYSRYIGHHQNPNNLYTTWIVGLPSETSLAAKIPKPLLKSLNLILQPRSWTPLTWIQTQMVRSVFRLLNEKNQKWIKEMDTSNHWRKRSSLASSSCRFAISVRATVLFIGYGWTRRRF